MADQEHHITSEVHALRLRINVLEAALQASHQEAITLFTEAPTPYLLLNSQGRIQDVNVAGARLLGRSREVLIGRQFRAFVSPESQGSVRVLLDQAFEDGLSRRGELQLLHEDDTILNVLLDVDAESAAGAFQRFRLTMTDITVYKQAHTQLLNTTTTQHEQLAAHSLRIRELNQELEEVVRVFIQQLNLPVSRAINLLGLTGSALGDSPEEVQQPLLKAGRAVQQMITLMASVERYIQMRSMRVRVRDVDLESVLRDVIKAEQPLLAHREVRITSERLPTVQGDSRALYLILDEYMANALKFTREKDVARIHLHVHETELEYHVGVEDNGVGFNMRRKDRLFRLFGRLHSSKDYEGTGVGLVTVRRSCLRFGGRAWAEGRVDQGATFWFAWPKEAIIRE
ncbi:sensor histidine kinase [Deinococcus hohokamensis]|uniref:histidine kinase n=1 Tax=Deinococcus hohokamensis TaxID=309883 RepID=A0ABV9I8H0_9DEIO